MIAADQIHPAPDREDNKEPQKSKKGKKDDKGKSTEDDITKNDISDKNTNKTESSVKPTNQKVHPTVR